MSDYHCLIYYKENGKTYLFTDSPDNIQKYLKELHIDGGDIDSRINFLKNNNGIYGNQCKINTIPSSPSAPRLLIWIFKDPSKFSGPMMYKQGKYIMEKVYLLRKSQNRSSILNTLIN